MERATCCAAAYAIIRSAKSATQELGCRRRRGRHIHLVLTHPAHDRLITRVLFLGDPLLAEMEYPELAIALERGRKGNEQMLFGTAEIMLER